MSNQFDFDDLEDKPPIRRSSSKQKNQAQVDEFFEEDKPQPNRQNKSSKPVIRISKQMSRNSSERNSEELGHPFIAKDQPHQYRDSSEEEFSNSPIKKKQEEVQPQGEKSMEVINEKQQQEQSAEQHYEEEEEDHVKMQDAAISTMKIDLKQVEKQEPQQISICDVMDNTTETRIQKQISTKRKTKQQSKPLKKAPNKKYSSNERPNKSIPVRRVSKLKNLISAVNSRSSLKEIVENRQNSSIKIKLKKKANKSLVEENYSSPQYGLQSHLKQVERIFPEEEENLDSMTDEELQNLGEKVRNMTIKFNQELNYRIDKKMLQINTQKNNKKHIPGVDLIIMSLKEQIKTGEKVNELMKAEMEHLQGREGELREKEVELLAERRMDVTKEKTKEIIKQISQLKREINGGGQKLAKKGDIYALKQSLINSSKREDKGNEKMAELETAQEDLEPKLADAEQRLEELLIRAEEQGLNHDYIHLYKKYEEAKKKLDNAHHFREKLDSCMRSRYQILQHDLVQEKMFVKHTEAEIRNVYDTINHRNTDLINLVKSAKLNPQAKAIKAELDQILLSIQDHKIMSTMEMKSQHQNYSNFRDKKTQAADTTPNEKPNFMKSLQKGKKTAGESTQLGRINNQLNGKVRNERHEEAITEKTEMEYSKKGVSEFSKAKEEEKREEKLETNQKKQVISRPSGQPESILKAGSQERQVIDGLTGELEWTTTKEEVKEIQVIDGLTGELESTFNARSEKRQIIDGLTGQLLQEKQLRSNPSLKGLSESKLQNSSKKILNSQSQQKLKNSSKRVSKVRTKEPEEEAYNFNNNGGSKRGSMKRNSLRNSEGNVPSEVKPQKSQNTSKKQVNISISPGESKESSKIQSFHESRAKISMKKHRDSNESYVFTGADGMENGSQRQVPSDNALRGSNRKHSKSQVPTEKQVFSNNPYANGNQDIEKHPKEGRIKKSQMKLGNQKFHVYASGKKIKKSQHTDQSSPKNQNQKRQSHDDPLQLDELIGNNKQNKNEDFLGDLLVEEKQSKKKLKKRGNEFFEGMEV